MKTRFIPENAETREFPAAAVVAYCYQRAGRAVVLAYKGRQTHRAVFLAFSTVDGRDLYLSEYVERETASETWKRERQQARHGLAVGDILYSVWGYEQTNVTYFQVVRVPSERSATVRQIAADITEDNPGSMTGISAPRAGEFVADAKPVTSRAVALHSLGGGERWRGSLGKWDGRPRHVTSYG